MLGAPDPTRRKCAASEAKPLEGEDVTAEFIVTSVKARNRTPPLALLTYIKSTAAPIQPQPQPSQSQAFTIALTISPNH